MVLGKWNYEKHEYEPYEVPDNWNVKLYSKDMDEIVNCPQCGRTVKYGATFTSLEIHDSIGLGFSVCYDCNQEEWGRRIANEKKGELK